MVYGLVAALGWGLSAVAATNAARRVGTYIAILAGQGVGVLLLLLLTATLRPSLRALDGHVALTLAGAGMLGLVGYLAFYRALEYGGAVGLVSAISATYGGVTTVLAVLLLGERLTAVGAAGVALAVAGVAFAAMRPAAGGQAVPVVTVGEPLVGVAPGPSRIRGLSRAGIPLALTAALTYGAGAFLLGDYSARVGWLPSALVAHGTSVTALLLALPLLGRRKAWRSSASGVAWAVAAGLTDAVGLLSFARGGQAGQVAVTAAVSSVYPAIPLVAGIVLFGEHLTRRQVLGVAGIVAGLVMIGTG